MFVYKFNVLESLKEAGYNTTRLKREKLISDPSVHKLRHNQMVGIKTLHTICVLLDMQPGNVIKYVEDPPEGRK